jgi:autotransporter-associated beta strand protein
VSRKNGGSESTGLQNQTALTAERLLLTAKDARPSVRETEPVPRDSEGLNTMASARGLAATLQDTVAIATTNQVTSTDQLADSSTSDPRDVTAPEAATALCPPSTIHGNIGQGSSDYSSISGSQTGRISNTGVASSCASAKSFPGLANSTPHAFDSYQFANDTGTTACVTFTFPQSCGINQAIGAAAYLGSFNPASLGTNYLGDLGGVINPSQGGAFSVNVPANSVVVLVVFELRVVTDCQNYSFSVTGLPCHSCPPTTITGSIGQGGTNYPSHSGEQTARLSQNGVNSSCASPKTTPGLASPGVSFTFDSYEFENFTGATTCVTFTFPLSCGANQAIHPVAYLGSFNPASPTSNYLDDLGHSISAGENGSFSVNVPPFAVVVLVVHEIGTAAGCPNYSFGVSGVPCPKTVTWDGSADTNWTTPANWVGDVAPSVGDNLVFPDNAARKTNNNNFATGTFGSLTFTGAGYVIGGNPITLSYGLTSNISSGGGPFFTPNITLRRPQAFLNNGTIDPVLTGQLNLNGFALTVDGVGNINLSGNVIGAGGITKNGGGTLLLLGPADTYAGVTQINNGLLDI